jgi:hypothetical protein
MDSRDNRYVIESYETAESNLTKFDNELARGVKADKEEVEEFQKYNKKVYLIVFFITVYSR